ncbi:MAG: hypothetical protein IT237_05660 [Bacteroidia bacterium]|nr:hypothetical protein [Bacteroidia bacterium]
MKKTIKFEFEDISVEVSGDDIIIPRIGEKIDLYNLFKTNDERKKYNELKNDKGTLFVIDIFHEFSQTEQVVEIRLSYDLDDKNDFYTSI